MDEEGLERMCKKISQLTRVIYLINTKNDDNQAIIESLISSYDNELDNIRKQAKDTIATYKAKIDKLQDTKGPEEKVKEIKRNYENSLLSFAETQKQFKDDIEKREGKVYKEYQEKYDKMVKQVNDLKRSTEKTLSERAKKDIEERDMLNKKHITDIEKLNKEFDIRRKQYEDKLLIMSNENKEQLDKMSNEHIRYIAIIKEEYEKKLREKDKTISQSLLSQSQLTEDIKTKHEEAMKNLLDENNNLKAKINDYEKEMSSITKKLNGYEIDIQVLKKAKDELEERLSKNANISLEEKNRIQKEIEDLKRQLQIEKSKSDDKTAKIKQIEDLLLSKDALIAQLTNDNILLRKDSSSELNKRDDMINDMKNKLSTLNNSLYERMNEIDSMKEIIDMLNRQIKDLNEQLTALNNDMSKTNQSTEQLVLELRKQILSNEKEYQKKNEDLVTFYEQRLKDIAAQTKAKEDQMNYDHSCKVNSLRDAFDYERSELESALANEKKSLSLKIKELTDALANSSQNSSSTITILEQRIKSLEESLSQSTSELSKLRLQMSSQTSTSEKEFNALKESYTEQIKSLQDKLLKAQQMGLDASKDSNKTIAKLKAEHQKEIGFMESNHREEIDRLKYQFTMASNEAKLHFDKEMSDLKIKLAGMEAEFFKNQKNTNESLNKLIKEQQKEIEELKQRSLLELNQMKNQYEDEIASMQRNAEKTLNEELTQLKYCYEEKIKQLSKEINEMKAKHNAEIAKVFNDNKKIIEDYEKQFKNDTMILNKTITELNGKVSSLETQIEKLSNVKDTQAETIRVLSEENSHLKSAIEDFNSRIAKAEIEAKESKETYEKMKELLTKEYEDKRQSIEKSLAERTKVFKDFHIGEFEKIKEEFLGTLQLVEKKNYTLTSELEDLKAFIAKRPSRDEDVDEINALRDELERKDREYQETTALLEQFRNELLNREENYNGYFDRKPKVGYVNPLKDKGDKQNKGNSNGNGNTNNGNGGNAKKSKALNMSGNTPNNFPKLVNK